MSWIAKAFSCTTLVSVLVVDAAAFGCVCLSARAPFGDALPPSLLGGVLVHALCAAVAAAVLAPAAPSFLRHRQGHVALFVVVMAFFLPVLGSLGALAALRLGFSERARSAGAPWLTLDVDTLRDGRLGRTVDTVHRRAAGPALGSRPFGCHEARRVSAAGIRATLGRAGSDTKARFDAVLATRRLSAKAAVPLLQLAQRDRCDEIRLYAFSRLERMRNDLERCIEEIMTALERADERDRAELRLRLAECHWELAYQGLAEGAVLEHALQRARENAAAACRDLDGHAGAHFLLGRILLRLRDPHRARPALQKSVRLGCPAHKAIPYLAECAFQERDLPAVGLLLAKLDARPREGLLFRPVIDVWGVRPLLRDRLRGESAR
jgi:polysaccharide biosynthesis protein PelE